MQVKVKINILNLIGAILALIVSIMTINGSILEWIQFADVLNEMAFAFTGIMLTICMAFLSFEKIK